MVMLSDHNVTCDSCDSYRTIAWQMTTVTLTVTSRRRNFLPLITFVLIWTSDRCPCLHPNHFQCPPNNFTVRRPIHFGSGRLRLLVICRLAHTVFRREVNTLTGCPALRRTRHTNNWVIYYCLNICINRQVACTHAITRDTCFLSPDDRLWQSQTILHINTSSDFLMLCHWN